ncbi:hypothetical protein GCM10011316_22800 [Roseibium aquae]|uniref:Uncharacterized protein n=1 Tax=Roseibium aquae TaxID=1323746 RepID=A0A916TLB2_9HYPH|nr:hypothetical protein [Roseibium aquae]GGB50139.1 hypothetical protein GCM10011316_22800 [Roseibium aquae]
MPEHALSTLIDEIAARGKVASEDVRRLRQAIYGGDGAVSLAEAAGLFRLNEQVSDADSAWHELFPEAMADLLVHQVHPAGYITEDLAAWLIRAVSHDGRVCTRTELDAVIHVLEKARQAPRALEVFALRIVKDSVISGTGATRGGHDLEPGVILDGEVELLRRLLYAGAGCGSIAISRPEAEVLFDINEATSQARNAPAWSELFAKAIANHVMALSGFTPPPREVALAREDWLAGEGGFDGGMKGFFRAMFGGGLAGIRDAYREDEPDAAAARGAAMEAEIAVNEVVTETEAEWLVERIGRDGVLHDNEKALLRFISEESPVIHPALRALFEKV